MINGRKPSNGAPGFGLCGHSDGAPSGPVLPDSHSQAGRHKYRGAALLDTPSWIHHQIAPDVLFLQDNMIFRSVIAVLLFLMYFISYFNFRLSYLFCS